MAVWSINSCRDDPNFYSCAVDTLCDIFFYSIFSYLSRIEIDETLALRNVLLSKLVELSIQRKLITANNRNEWSKSRENVWNWLVANMAKDFGPKGRVDAAIDNTFLSFECSNLFTTKSSMTCNICKRCFNRCTGKLGVNTLLIAECDGNIGQIVKRKMQQTRLCCSQNMSLTVTKLPKILMIMLPVSNMHQPVMYSKLAVEHEINVVGETYKLTGAVRATGSHFVPFSLINNSFYELDDLKSSTKSSDNFTKCLNSTAFCRRKCCANGSSTCDRQKLFMLIYVKSDSRMTINLPVAESYLMPVSNSYILDEIERRKSESIALKNARKKEYEKHWHTVKRRKLRDDRFNCVNESTSHSATIMVGQESVKLQKVEQTDADRKRMKRKAIKSDAGAYADYLLIASKRMQEKRSKIRQNECEYKHHLSVESSRKKMKKVMQTHVGPIKNECAESEIAADTTAINKTYKKRKRGVKVTAKCNKAESGKCSCVKQSVVDSRFDESISVAVSNCAICTKILFKEQVRIFRGKFPKCTRIASGISSHILCSICLNNVNKNIHPPLCYENNLDPGICKLLNNLSYLEQRWVNLINVFMTVANLPGGQYCQSGQAIHFLNNIEELHDKLPSTLDESGVVVLDKDGNVAVESSQIVRSKLVSKCIWWLKSHNDLFANISIPIKYWVPSVTADMYDANLSAFIPAQEISLIAEDYTPPTLESVKESLNYTKETSLNTVKLAKCDGLPVSIFRDTKLEEKAYVKLFPFGKNGYGESRETKLTILAYLKSRLEGTDDRFRSNISYLFWALNVFEQYKIQEQISVALKTTASGENCRMKIVDNILNNSSYTFIRNIRGTVGYWKNVLVDLLAKIKTLGPPTWFVTLSADDNHWPDVQQLCNYDVKFKSGSEAVRQNPVLASKQFRRRWIEIFRWLKTSKALGCITDHFERVEFQNRGSPHLHIFIWIANSPDLKTAEGKRNFPAFIDKYVSTSIPADEYVRSLVLKYQIHKHTDTCKCKKAKNGHTCRFRYPRSACEETKLVQNVNYTTSRKFYETKRNSDETFVNAYNEKLLSMWKANMDVQFVGNAFGVAAYVCDYICKSEPKKLKDSIQQAVADIKESKEMSARQMLSKFGHVFLSNRCIGAYEAAFRLLGIPLVNSTRGTIYVNCRAKEYRYRMIKKEFLKTDVLLYTTEEICHLGLIDYYMLRPNEEMFNSMSLLEFASWYSVVGKSPSKSAYNIYYKLQNCDRYIRKRNNSACIRTNQVCLRTDPEGYYIRLLMLHVPFRCEDELKQTFSSYKESFLSKSETVRSKVLEQEKFSEELEKAIQQLRIIESDNTSDLVSQLSKQNEKQTPTNFRSQLSSNCSNNDNNKRAQLAADMLYNHNFVQKLESYTTTDDEFAQKLADLNVEQRLIADEIKYKVEQQLQDETSEKIHLFVSGKGGTGKSYLIDAIYELLIRLYNTNGNSVLKTAPTGVASCNIDGSTLHRTLLLPVSRYRTEYIPLDPFRLQQARHFFKSVQFIIIDEISMVSYRTLTFIHKRLCEVKANTALFGGLNVLALGDFYQLRPVADRFVFTATNDLKHLWNDVFSTTVLTNSVRHKSDPHFAAILDSIRVGNQLTAKMISSLQLRVNAHLTEKEFENSLHIFALKVLVNQFNDEKLNELQAKSNMTATVITSTDVLLNPSASSTVTTELTIPFTELDSSGLSTTVRMLKGARVMLIRNLSVQDKLVNGSVGSVINIVSDDQVVKRIVVQFDHIDDPVEIERLSIKIFTDSRDIWERSQFPLQLCFAATIHKVQGLTLPKVVVDCGPTIFEAAMAYVAISRVRKLKDVSFTHFCEKSLRAFQVVTDYYKTVADNESALQ